MVAQPSEQKWLPKKEGDRHWASLERAQCLSCRRRESWKALQIEPLRLWEREPFCRTRQTCRHFGKTSRVGATASLKLIPNVGTRHFITILITLRRIKHTQKLVDGCGTAFGTR